MPDTTSQRNLDSVLAQMFVRLSAWEHYDTVTPEEADHGGESVTETVEEVQADPSSVFVVQVSVDGTASVQALVYHARNADVALEKAQEWSTAFYHASGGSNGPVSVAPFVLPSTT